MARIDDVPTPRDPPTVNRFRSANAPLDAAPVRSGPLDRAWRVTMAGTCFAVFGLATLLVSGWLLLVIRPMPFVPPSRKGAWVRAWFQRLSRSFIDLLQSLGLMHYTVENAERLRRPGRPGGSGQLIVANHPSLIDALFIIGYAPGVCCIVKRELLDNPFTSWLVRSAGYLTNDSDTLLDDAARVLHAGRSLLIFPEGTRNRSDLSLRFKRGAAHVAIAADADLLPVTIDFSPRALQKGQPWYRLPGRASRIRLIVHEPLDAVATARAALPVEVPVTVLARRVSERLRGFFLEQALLFADPQGLSDSVPEARPDSRRDNGGPCASMPASGGARA